MRQVTYNYGISWEFRPGKVFYLCFLKIFWPTVTTVHQIKKLVSIPLIAWHVRKTVAFKNFTQRARVGTCLHEQALLLADDNNKTQSAIEIDLQKDES